MILKKNILLNIFITQLSTYFNGWSQLYNVIAVGVKHVMRTFSQETASTLMKSMFLKQCKYQPDCVLGKSLSTTLSFLTFGIVLCKSFWCKCSCSHAFLLFLWWESVDLTFSTYFLNMVTSQYLWINQFPIDTISYDLHWKLACVILLIYIFGKNFH